MVLTRQARVDEHGKTGLGYALRKVARLASGSLRHHLASLPHLGASST